MSARQIWKFPISQTVIEMPCGAEILSVQYQGGEPCVWAVCDPAAAKQMIEFSVYGTGQPLPDRLGRYIGTLQSPPFVWHVYYNGSPK